MYIVRSRKESQGREDQDNDLGRECCGPTTEWKAGQKGKVRAKIRRFAQAPGLQSKVYLCLFSWPGILRQELVSVNNKRVDER